MSTLLQRAEDVSNEVLARVARCTTANGAETDLGRTVYRGRRTIDDDMIPCTVLLEGQDRVSEQLAHRAHVEQQYVMYAYVPCDAANPNTAAHAALRDLKRAFFTAGGRPDWTFERRVKQVHYNGKDIAPRADGAAFVCVVFDIAVEYAETLSAP